jgi:hypothetical protein
MEGGAMSVSGGASVSDTRKINPQDNDTVFTSTGRIAQGARVRQQAARGMQQARSMPAAGQDRPSSGGKAPAGKTSSSRSGKKQSLSDINNPRARTSKKTPRRRSRLNGGVIAAIAAGLVVIGVIVIVIAASSRQRKINEGIDASTETTTKAVDVISFSIEDGEEYTAPLEVIVESSLGNRIYYTIDGSQPTNSSTKYYDKIRFKEEDLEGESMEITLRIVTYTEISMKAGEKRITFTLKKADLAAPVISPGSGDYDAVQIISISAERGASIYYTYDGSEPTEESELYSGSIEMKRGNNVLSAIAISGSRRSEVASVVYNLEIEALYSYDKAYEMLKDYLEDLDFVVDPDDSMLSEAETDEDGNPAESGIDKYVLLSSGGTVLIDQNQYYIFISETYDSKGSITDSGCYGVEDQIGSIVTLTKDGSEYYVEEKHD